MHTQHRPEGTAHKHSSRQPRHTQQHHSSITAAQPQPTVTTDSSISPRCMLVEASFDRSCNLWYVEDWQVFHYFATGSDCEWHWTVELLGGDDMVRWLAWAMLFLALWGCAGAPAEAADVSEVPVEPADVPEVPAEPAVDVGKWHRRDLRWRLMRRSQWRESRASCLSRHGWRGSCGGGSCGGGSCAGASGGPRGRAAGRW